MPDDSRIPGQNVEEMALNGSVLSSVKFGGPILTIDRTIFEMWMVYPPTKRGPSEGRRVNGKGN